MLDISPGHYFLSSQYVSALSDMLRINSVQIWVKQQVHPLPILAGSSSFTGGC